MQCDSYPGSLLDLEATMYVTVALDDFRIRKLHRSTQTHLLCITDADETEENQIESRYFSEQRLTHSNELPS